MGSNERDKVLIVGINYAPEHTGIAPYTTAAARHLVAEGHDVTVWTGIPHYPEWAVPDDYRWRLRSRETVDGIDVHRLRHFVPAGQDAFRRSWYEISFGLQVLENRPVGRPGVVLAVVPSLFGAAAAARIARRTHARFVVWVQDSMAAAAQQSGMPGGRLVAGAVGRLERRVFAQADRVIVVSDGFRRSLEQVELDPDRIVTLPNWVHVARSNADRSAVRRAQGWAEEDRVVLHSGNMGLKQGLDSVLDAARSARERHSRLRFVLMGDGSQRADLEARAGAVDGLDIIDPVADADYAAVLEAADVLLVNERPGVIDMSLPSKLTSYFASGRPVVASVDAGGGTAAEVRRSGGGVVTANQTPASLVTTLEDLFTDPGRMAELGAAGLRHAEDRLSAGASLQRLSQLVGTPYRAQERERT